MSNVGIYFKLFGNSLISHRDNNTIPWLAKIASTKI